MTKIEHEHLHRPTAQTCPECGGAMSEQAVGKLTQFRCHIGHVMTAEVLATSQREALEKDLSSALRTLNERVELCRAMAQKCGLLGDLESKERWAAAGKEADREFPSCASWSKSNGANPRAANEIIVPNSREVSDNRLFRRGFLWSISLHTA
ncbi:MAG TPA: hypothetical protein VEU06_00220 [Micropepsaceae bacterium]|nr:hypothetical protein [Micropepsaceae bacterium]